MPNETTDSEGEVQERLWQLATAVRDSCYAQALAAYEDARADGLCHEGAWECAVAAMRAVDFDLTLANVMAQR